MASTQASHSDICQPVTRAVEEGDWPVLGQWIDSDQLTEQQKVWVIMEISHHVNSAQFLHHIFPVCSSAQIDCAMTQLVTEDRWQDALNLSLNVGDETRRWKIGDQIVNNALLRVVAKGRWEELSAVLHRCVHLTAPETRWALLQACRHAGQREILEVVVPYCADEDLHSVLTELVSRRLWWAVGSLIRQRKGISEAQQTWAISRAAREASTWELSEYILPLCTKTQLTETSKQLFTRQLWGAVQSLLHKDDDEFSECVLQVCVNEDMDLFMAHLISEGQWDSVQKLLHVNRKMTWMIENVTINRHLIQRVAEGRWEELVTEVTESKHHPLIAWVIQVMSKRAGQKEICDLLVDMCPMDQVPQVLENVVKRGFIDSGAKLLCCLLAEVMWYWTDSSFMDLNIENQFWIMVRSLSFDVKVVSELCTEVHKAKQMYISSFNILKQITSESVIENVLVSFCSHQDKPTPLESDTDEASLLIDTILRKSEHYYSLNNLLQKIRHVCFDLNCTRTENVTNPLFALSFIRAIMSHYEVNNSTSKTMEAILATVPVVPSVQCQALKALLLKKEWDIIRHADLSQVSETVRRQLFYGAVNQKQWSVVRLWADHSLHDDQRVWALRKAFKEEQWDVMLDLAGDGLTEDEVIRVHCNIARRADLNVVLGMYRREADVSEVKELLTSAVREATGADDKQELEKRVCQLAEVEARLRCKMERAESLESAVQKNDWQLVVFTVRHRPSADSMHQALQAASARKAWHAVTQLLRLGTVTFDDSSFFHEMMRRQQWRICRAMVEQGLNVDVYVDAIPKLMELNQWSVVAKMVGHDVGDAARRRVIHCALGSKQGTVVSLSLQSMKQRLTLQEREDLFHKAIVHDALQAVRPLVQEKDETGIYHRDVAMVHALRQRQWDIVDLCQHLHASIDILDDQGNTPAISAAHNRDWESVMALVKRGADLSLTDNEGRQLIHMAIKDGNWECVKMLFQYPCDMQQHFPFIGYETVLESLISARQHQIVEHAALHCPVQWTGVNRRGETTLHTVCLYGLADIMCTLLDRGVNPLSVTHRGHSVLTYAVLSTNPQTMVRECISLGFPTHQPRLTSQGTQPLSPVLLTVMRGLPEETRMLYESGSCTSKELFSLLPELNQLADPSSIYFHWKWRDICEKIDIFELVEIDQYGLSHLLYSKPRKCVIRKSACYLMDASSTPRSLMFMCRLVISHCLRVSGSRERDIDQLPLCSPLKRYVSFSDLLSAGDGQSAHSGTQGTGDESSEEDDYWSDYKVD